MTIEQLDIHDFRNLGHILISPAPYINIIVGKNGSGKTSLLETIYYLGSARSFRTPHSKHLTKIGESKFDLYARIRKRDATFGIGISRNFHQVKIKIANTLVTNSSQLAEFLPVQLINPDVHKMMEEGPRYRRRFLEWGLFHVKPNYFPEWQQCRHILKQRNAALKQHLSTHELVYWDDALCEISERITKVRDEYIEQLQPHLDELIKSVGNLPYITVLLDRGWSAHKTLKQALDDSRDGDRKKGFTQLGPHRADLQILAENLRAKDVVSRGQQKMLTAIMKIAQVKNLVEAEKGVDNILLVDDLPAELDSDYRQRLLSIIINLKVQTFITATDKELLDVSSSPSDVRLFHVEHGSIEQIN